MNLMDSFWCFATCAAKEEQQKAAQDPTRFNYAHAEKFRKIVILVGFLSLEGSPNPQGHQPDQYRNFDRRWSCAESDTLERRKSFLASSKAAQSDVHLTNWRSLLRLEQAHLP